MVFVVWDILYWLCGMLGIEEIVVFWLVLIGGVLV